MSKFKTCNKCNEDNLMFRYVYDYERGKERWVLFNQHNVAHECPVKDVKYVKCKYCDEGDMYWSKEKMEDGSVKNVLIGPFGLPHGCDQQREHFENIKKTKRAEYDAEKTKIMADKSLSGRDKRMALLLARNRIWPGISERRRYGKN